MRSTVLANAEYSRPSLELLKPHIRPRYEAVVGDSEGFSLYVTSTPSQRELKTLPKSEQTSHHLIYDYCINMSAFHPLIDFHLTTDAGKLFTAYVSMWPGCFALRRDKAATSRPSPKRRGLLAASRPRSLPPTSSSPRKHTSHIDPAMSLSQLRIR